MIRAFITVFSSALLATGCQLMPETTVAGMNPATVPTARHGEQLPGSADNVPLASAAQPGREPDPAATTDIAAAKDAAPADRRGDGMTAPMSLAPDPADWDAARIALSMPPPTTNLWERIRRQLTWDTGNNKQVALARDQYLLQFNYLPVVAERAGLYLYYIVEEVERRGLPIELALLPLVESTLDPFARSHNYASGLWQIMPATGKHLGLTTTWWYDGRQDLRDSTRVALDYLESLHKRFDGDWLLALAAYNSGKGRVGRARAANLKRGKSADYWSLQLPRETRHYVPRLLALASIVDTPQTFDAELPPVANSPAFAVVPTGGQLEMARAADLAGIELGPLRALNPGQLRWATAPHQAQELLLPVANAEQFSAGVAALDSSDRVRWRHYRINRGDSLSQIARKFDTEVALLRETNGISGNLIRAGDTLMIPQRNAWQGGIAGAAAIPQSRDYRVRRGDSLYRIAARFKVSIADLISWNSLQPGAYLQPGQQLTLYPGDG